MIATCFDPFPVLHTNRLVLRHLSHADTEEVFFLRSDPGVMRYTGQSLATSRDEICQYIDGYLARQAAGEGILWGIVPLGAERLAGLIGYRRFYREHYRGEVGYGIHPGYQGQGLMHEAIGAVIGYGFTQIGLHSIEANVDKDNLASIRLLERNNFVKEAHFRENYFFEGRFIDSVIYSLINDQRC